MANDIVHPYANRPYDPTITTAAEMLDSLATAVVTLQEAPSGGGAAFQRTDEFNAVAETAMSAEALVAIQSDGIDQWGVCGQFLLGGRVAVLEPQASQVEEWFGLVQGFIVMAANASVVAPSVLVISPAAAALLLAQAGTDPLDGSLSWEVSNDGGFIIPVGGIIEGVEVPLAYLVFTESYNAFVLRDAAGDDILCQVEDNDYIVFGYWHTWSGSTPG